MNLGLIIRETRLKAGLTQLELATALGYDSMQFVSLFERGLSKVPMKTLGAMFEILKFKEKDRQKIIAFLVKSYSTKIQIQIAEGETNGNK
jgi:transcriptional regulator with XRE-family HTH domain